MRDMGVVLGSIEQAQELVIGADTVYVHTNIQPVTEDTQGNPIEGLYQYNEIQYSKNEYIKMVAEKNSYLESQLTDTQLALCEIFESLEG